MKAWLDHWWWVPLIILAFVAFIFGQLRPPKGR